MHGDDMKRKLRALTRTSFRSVADKRTPEPLGSCFRLCLCCACKPARKRRVSSYKYIVHIQVELVLSDERSDVIASVLRAATMLLQVFGARNAR